MYECALILIYDFDYLKCMFALYFSGVFFFFFFGLFLVGFFYCCRFFFLFFWPVLRNHNWNIMKKNLNTDLFLRDKNISYNYFFVLTLTKNNGKIKLNCYILVVAAVFFFYLNDHFCIVFAFRQLLSSKSHIGYFY